MKPGLQQFLIFALLLGILGGAWQLGFKRLGEKRESLQADIRVKQDILDTITASGKTASKLGQEMKRLQEEIDRFDQRLPKSKSEYSMQQDLSRIAESRGVQITSTRPLPIVKSQRCHELPIELKFAGEFLSFSDFLRDVESLERITRVTALSISRSDDVNKPTAGTVTISIFFEPDTAASAN
jgi:Tfp pilus assembly protein PilO